LERKKACVWHGWTGPESLLRVSMMLRNTTWFARSFSGGGGYIGILKQLEHGPEGLGAMLKIIYIPDRSSSTDMPNCPQK